MKSNIIKDYLEPSKIEFMAIFINYFEPTSNLNPLFFSKNFCMLRERLISHRAMAPPPI